MDNASWFSFNNNSSGLAFDSSKSGCLDFDGTDDYVEIANESNFDIGTACTITAWVYLEGLGEGNYGRIIDKASAVSSTALDGFQFHCNTSNSFGAAVGCSTTNARSVSATSVLSLNVWTYLVMVFNEDGSKKIKQYKDGVKLTLATDTAGVGTIDHSSVNPRIGNYAGDTTRTFDGKIAVVSFYNRALSADEVSQNYEATKTRFVPRITKSGLVGNWDAGDPEWYVGGTTCKDTANGTTATFKNWDGGNNITEEANFNSANGGYWEFDGTDQYIQCSTNSVLQPQSFSVEAWAKESTDGGEVLALPIVSWKSGANKYPAVYTSYHVAKTPIIFLSGSDYREFNNTAVSVAGWHHVMFTYTYDDVSTSAFYVDGVSIASGTTVNGTKDSTNTCIIGAIQSTYYYKGSIALVRMYDNALSAAEVLDNYQKTKARFGH